MPKATPAKKTTKAKAARVADRSAKRSAPADMAPDKFREIGHSLVDAVADFLARLPDAPTASPLLPDAMRSVLGKR